MPDTCSAYGCTTRRNLETRKRGITFHRFPSDKVLKKRWENAVRRKGFSASCSSLLCSQHFREEDFDRTGQTVRIREGAVPSVFNFPAHLQKKPVKPRQTTTSIQAAAPLQVKEQEDVPEGLGYNDHSYTLAPSLDQLKSKLVEAQARVEELERQLHNVKVRERRCKTTLTALMEENLRTDELKQKKLNSAVNSVTAANNN